MNQRTTTISQCTLPTGQIDPRRTGGDFIYIDIASISRETKRIENPKCVACADAPSRARKHVKENDILVSTVRPNLNAVALVGKEYDQQIASTGFAVLRPDTARVHPHYLFYRVRSAPFIMDMESNAKGANYPAVSELIVGNHSLPLPPLSEQHRIVEILDQADALRQLRRQADQISRQLLSALFCEMRGDEKVVTKEVMVAFLESQGLQDTITGAAQPRISSTNFGRLRIPLPPPELLTKFTDSSKSITAIRNGSTTNTTTLETLFQTLLHRAFDGSLTARWREGHAKELLQEMKHQTR